MMNFWEQQKKINSLYGAMAKRVCDKYELTQMELGVLLFFSNNPQYKTASDLVKTMVLTKSHVSAALKALEEKGLILRKQIDGNKKSVQIKILPSALSIISEGREMQRTYFDHIFGNFAPEEIKICEMFYLKMCNNAEEHMKEYE